MESFYLLSVVDYNRGQINCITVPTLGAFCCWCWCWPRHSACLAMLRAADDVTTKISFYCCQSVLKHNLNLDLDL